LGKMNKDEAMEQYVQTLTALVPDWQSNDYKSVSHVESRAIITTWSDTQILIRQVDLTPEVQE
jgi:hypothetical protein